MNKTRNQPWKPRMGRVDEQLDIYRPHTISKGIKRQLARVKRQNPAEHERQCDVLGVDPKTH